MRAQVRSVALWLMHSVLAAKYRTENGKILCLFNHEEGLPLCARGWGFQKASVSPKNVLEVSKLSQDPTLASSP